MNVADVKVDIMNKTIKPYYIFTGDEIEVQRIYINKIAEVLQYEVMRVESIKEVWSAIVSPSLFNTACVYVVRDDKDLLQDETIQEQIEHNRLNGNIIIHLLTSVDKRTKFYKANSDKIVVFERLSDEMLLKYVQRLTTLNKRNSERLIAICESDYSRILTETDKINSFIAAFPDCDSNKVFEQFVNDGVISTPAKDAIFELVDAILKRTVNQAYDMYNQCLSIGEASMVILSVLYNNAKQVFQVQTCLSSDVCKATGLTSWQVKCAKEKAGHYTHAELLSMLKLIQEIQKDIITGKLEDCIAIDYLLVNVL